MQRALMAIASASLISILAACRAQAPSTPPPTPAPSGDKAVSELQSQSARFAPTDLTADITALPANEREALAHMVRAAQVMDALFLEQVWAGNESMLYTLIKDESPLGKARLAWVTGLTALAVACHPSHLGLLGGLLICAALLRLGARWRLPRPDLKSPSCCAVATGPIRTSSSDG